MYGDREMEEEEDEEKNHPRGEDTDLRANIQRDLVLERIKRTPETRGSLCIRWPRVSLFTPFSSDHSSSAHPIISMRISIRCFTEDASQPGYCSLRRVPVATRAPTAGQGHNSLDRGTADFSCSGTRVHALVPVDGNEMREINFLSSSEWVEYTSKRRRMYCHSWDVSAYGGTWYHQPATRMRCTVWAWCKMNYFSISLVECQARLSIYLHERWTIFFLLRKQSQIWFDVNSDISTCWGGFLPARIRSQ